MADYGEWLPMDAKLFSGVSAFDYHDQYAVDWARVNREAIREAGREGDIVFFNRSGALGSAKYSTLFWAGDQMVSWGQNDGLPSAICAMVTSGLSGISINHTDIGGYTTVDNALLKVKRDEELLKRWIEFAAFTPVYRTHEGLKPESNVQIYSSDSILRFFARFGRIHWGLRDYFKELNKESASQGIPIVRALLLEFPNDTLTYSIKDQFMLGPDLLVAPVITRGAVSRSVYFPEGQWINIWTKEKVEGNSTHIVSAPIGSPPVYIRQNSQWTDRLTQCLK
jgi:alpha-glucosidase